MQTYRYPELGPKRRVTSLEEAMQSVKNRYPQAYSEGSTGPERSFWVDGRFVAYAWPVRGKNEFWLRVLPLEWRN